MADLLLPSRTGLLPNRKGLIPARGCQDGGVVFPDCRSAVTYFQNNVPSMVFLLGGTFTNQQAACQSCNVLTGFTASLPRVTAGPDTAQYNDSQIPYTKACSAGDPDYRVQLNLSIGVGAQCVMQLNVSQNGILTGLGQWEASGLPLSALEDLVNNNTPIELSPINDAFSFCGTLSSFADITIT